MTEHLSLSPKARFLANKAAASAHSDAMASPAFQHAAATALLEYQYRTCSNEPTVLAIAASKMKGAQEFLSVLLNLGLPESTGPRAPLAGLVSPEEALARRYEADSP